MELGVLIIVIAGMMFLSIFGMPFLITASLRYALKELAGKWGGKVNLTWLGGSRLRTVYRSHQVELEVIPGYKRTPTRLKARVFQVFPCYLKVVRKYSVAGMVDIDLSRGYRTRILTGIPDFDKEFACFGSDETALRRFFLDAKRRDEVRYLFMQDAAEVRISPSEIAITRPIEGNVLTGFQSFPNEPFVKPLLDSMITTAEG